MGAFTLILAALVGVASFYVYKLSLVEFPVHQEGIVIVSGASTGIGEDIAETLAKAGYTVMAGIRKESDAEKVKSKGIKNLLPLQLDVTKQEDIDQALEQVSQLDLPLVGIVNNAGIAYSLPVELADMDKFERTIDTNLFGVVRLTKAFLPMLRENHGRIINIGSVAGFLYKGGCGAYCASKAAIEALSDALRRELKAHQVSVSLIEPAAVATPIWDKNTGDNAQIADIPQEKLDVYSNIYNEKVRESLKTLIEKAAGPEVVSEASLHALTSPFPQTRYVVATVYGAPAWLLKLIVWLVPDRVEDLIFGGAM